MIRKTDRIARESALAAGLAACFLVSGLLSDVDAGAALEVTESTFNAGGNPAAGVVPASPSFRITLDALGDSVAGTAMSSGSYGIEGGMPSAFPPPGPVTNLRFASASNEILAWDPERSAGTYGVYRGLISDLASPGGPAPYGSCFDAGAAEPTSSDADLPPSGDGFFYLVTVANRLGEEGTKSVEGAFGTVERPFTCSDSCFCDPATCAGGCNP